MILPRGNPLIEDIKLGYTDINIMMNNLEQEGFSGYILFDYSGGKTIFFFLHGGIINTLEVKDEAGEVYDAQLAAKFFNRIRKIEANVSVYILTPNMASVLSNVYLFNPLYKNHETGKKELMLILNEIEENSYTGFLSALGQDGLTYVVFDKGKLVIDNFAEKAGQIICSSEKIHSFFDYITGENGKIFFYAQAQKIIDSRKKEIQKKLNRIKQLIIKGEVRFIGKSDLVKIDEYIVREWGIKSASFTIEVESTDGKTYKLEASAGKKLGGYAAFSNSLIKKLNFKEGDLVNISPIE